jgi:hypothetical protein
MKKMFLATCMLAASVFAAPSVEDVKAATEKPVVEAKTAVNKAKTATVKKKAQAKAKADAAVNDAKAAVAATETKAAETANAATAEAKAVVTEKAPAAEVKALEAAKANAAAVETKVPAEPIIPAIAPTPVVEPAPVAEVKAPEAPAPVVEAPAPVAKAEPTPVVEVPTVAQADEVAVAEPASTTSRKKKKMIENAVFTVNQIDFDINADFELEAGKVLWSSEDDDDMDNLETWNGQANLAILAETQNFKGKVAVAFYPGDLKTDSDNHAVGDAEDYFSLDEAWAYQSKDWFSFKVGRWDNTDKNGDYFGGYIDGYKSGFLSTQDAENQFEFGFVPNENIDIALSFISKSAHLNKGDLRVVFNFHDLPSLEMFDIQLGYRSNIFDRVHDSDVDIVHNASLKVRAPIVPDFFTIFGEVALMDMANDIVAPLTGGFEFNFKTVDRVILEAEFVHNRHNHRDFIPGKTKHIKDVLAALYLEKALTDRFSLSAGLHNYNASKDFTISGNLVGRIN